MVRLRLYETLSLLPANTLESSHTHLLRMLVSEFINPANTTNSLLRDLCHSDDSIILGTWLQETEHKSIEDQVRHFWVLFAARRGVSWDIPFVLRVAFVLNQNQRHSNSIYKFLRQMEPNRKSYADHVSWSDLAEHTNLSSVLVFFFRFSLLL